MQTVPILSKDEAELCRCGGAGSNQREMEGVGGRAQNRGAWSTAVKEICAESLGKGGGVTCKVLCHSGFGDVSLGTELEDR